MFGDVRKLDWQKYQWVWRTEILWHISPLCSVAWQKLRFTVFRVTAYHCRAFHATAHLCAGRINPTKAATCNVLVFSSYCVHRRLRNYSGVARGAIESHPLPARSRQNVGRRVDAEVLRCYGNFSWCLVGPFGTQWQEMAVDWGIWLWLMSGLFYA